MWFDGNAKEAGEFYSTVFNNAKITSNNGLVVMFEIEGKKIMGLNGGPMFKINPSISFFVNCETSEEIDTIWQKLLEGGRVMMGLDKYPWAEKYGWLADKFDVTWQLMLSDLPAGMPKINPCFLFANEQYGKAQDAMKQYTTIFPDSKIHALQLYQAGEPQPEGYVKFGHFNLGKELFAAMDGPGNHQFQFNEGFSLVVECDTQEEIDNYWNKLTDGGQESQCGWLKDRYGVSWQIVPTILSKLMSDAEKAPRVMQAFMKMKKFDIETLMNA